MMDKYDLVVFDWDGTLMDSIGRIIDSVAFAAEKLEMRQPTEQEVRDIIGLSLDIAIKKLFPEVTSEQVQLVRGAYKEFYLNQKDQALPLFPNALEFLLALKEANKTLAVATGKGRPGLEEALIISETHHLFCHSRTADEAESKPSPDMLQQILASANIPASRALMIGDSIHDMNMAKAAGMDRIGVSFGAHDTNKLSAAEPLMVIDDYAELIALL